ncbi:MAG: helix-turn-helix domain-containing protein [Solirubrobacteraceae bacterium]
MATTTTDRPIAQDTSFHDRRLARRLNEDPEFRAEFERQQREIAVIDAIVNKLDALRAQHGMTKADLARAIDKNPAAVRRLLTASGNPELRTVVALAEALDADVQIVPRKTSKRARRASKTLEAV